MGPKGHTNYMLTTISLGEQYVKESGSIIKYAKAQIQEKTIFESSPALDHLNRAAITRGKKKFYNSSKPK